MICLAWNIPNSWMFQRKNMKDIEVIQLRLQRRLFTIEFVFQTHNLRDSAGGGKNHIVAAAKLHDNMET